MADRIIYPRDMEPPENVVKKINDFLDRYVPYELENGSPLYLYFDNKSGAFYLTGHLQATELVQSCDTDASLEGDDEDELYRLNREVTEDQVAYKIMEEDALKGRSFEDIVLEYDTSYHPRKPLKVYGGQHRLMAISVAVSRNINRLHGVRIYYCLTRDQKVEIATVNNTAIAVPDDLIDRMREQLLGSELRDWCQRTGLLDTAQDFADRRSPDTPTVRIARTLIVNYYLGKGASDIEVYHQPVICKSGGIDDEYFKIRSNIEWADENLLEMGRQFASLHTQQRDTVANRDNDKYAEFARKALSLAVVASWAFAAGLFQRNSAYLTNLYSLTHSTTPPDDPLNAKALSLARKKGTDPDTYRGLGTRSSARELGRMLEVFLVLATKAKRRINRELANAAIQSYEAKRATHEAEKVLGRI